MSGSQITPTVELGNGNNGWGNMGEWIIGLVALGMLGNGGFFGGNGNNRGNLATTDYIASEFTQNAIHDLSTQICGGFGDTNNNICNGFANTNTNIANGFSNQAIGTCNQTTTLLQGMNANQLSTLNGFNDVNTNLCQNRFDTINTIVNGINGLNNTLMQNEMARQNCCCEQLRATDGLKYTIATENCQDREALNNGVRDIIANQQNGIQAILDKLCQQEIDQKNETIANLRTQLNMQSLASSQANQTNDLINTLRPCPIPAYLTCSPYQSYNYNPFGNNCNCNNNF